MNDPGFWGQSWWQGVGSLFGILAFIIGVVALIVSIRQNRKKKLSYRVLYSQSLFSVDKQVQDTLKITYNGLQVDQLNIFEFIIINNGKLPVKKEDFDGPIELRFDSCNLLFEIIVLKCHPDNLKLSFSHEDNRVDFSPLLLNPDDFFKIRIIFDGKNRKFNLVSRVEGITEIFNITSHDYHYDLFFDNRLFAYILAVLTIVFMYFGYDHFYVKRFPEYTVFFIGCLSSTLILAKTLSEKLSEKVKKQIQKNTEME